jgi:outer membrane protein OmpA-like peptidoglycan-associated protein
MKLVPILLLLVLCNLKINAQNYLANNSFEAVNNCVEYHADCAPEAWFNIPATNYGVALLSLPKPVYGESVLYLPIGSVMENFNKPRFVYTAICCPLIANEKYVLSFYIAGTTVPFDSIGIYFTTKEPTINNKQIFTPTNCIKLSNTNVDDVYKKQWKHIKYEFTATGNEKFMSITTLGLQQKEYNMKESMNKSGDVFYFIDEIILKPINASALCNEYKSIEDKLFNQNYRHSDAITIFKEEPIKPSFIVKKDTLVIGDLLFEFGKYSLTKAIESKLEGLLSMLDSTTLQTLEVIGHTDSVGNTEKNKILSLNRSKSIKNYLTSKKSFLAPKIKVDGKGATEPKATNTTVMGRQTNRRVEIIITRLEWNKIKNDVL